MIKTWNDYEIAIKNEDINSLIDLIFQLDFDIIINTDNTLSFKDLQGGNLSNIEDEKFINIIYMCNRLEDNYLYGWLDEEELL